jgi:outer membrane protein OmpA-like peptidoglycan-associated protein/osmotically-inducible protein OsmY
MFNNLSTLGAYMSKRRWWWWSILGLIGLYLLMMVTRCAPIEKDIQARTEAALTDKGHDWAKVTLEGRGRDVMLSGVAPSEAARTEAVETATGIYGARIVESGITIKEYGTPVFGLNNEDGKTILTGSLPEQGLIDTAVRAASDNFGPANVVNRMTVSNDVSAPSWLSSALTVLPTLTGMKDADFDINNDGATLNGTFHTEEEKQAFATMAGDKLSGKFTDSSVVVALGPTPEELAEIARLAEEAEAAKIAEEKRVAAEAEVARMAEESKIAAVAAAAAAALATETEATKMANEASEKLAEEARLAKIAAVKELADIETAKAEMAEVKRLADIEKAKAEMAEVKRLADIEKAKAEMAEAKHLAGIEKAKAEMAEAKHLAGIEKAKAEMAEAKRLADIEKAKAEMAEVKRLADIEKAKAEMAEAKRLADIEKAKAEMAEVKRLADIEKAKAEMAEVKRLADIEKAKAEMAEAKAAEEKRMAEEAAQLQETERLRVEAQEAEVAAALAAKQAELTSCQNKLNDAMSGNSILFATSSSRINTKSYPLLDIIATTAKQCGDIIISNAQSIEVSGHTDSRGADAMNLKLSESRAKSVRDYLLSKGVRSSLIISKGYGEVNPVATNDTAAGRQQNRRIQFTIQ